MSAQFCLSLSILLCLLVNNVSSSMTCIKCRGLQEECEGKTETITCGNRYKVCYSLLQDDGERQIVSKHCATKGFCETAKMQNIRYLTYCKECNASSCNSESAFPQNVFPKNGAADNGGLNKPVVALLSTLLIIFTKYL